MKRSAELCREYVKDWVYQNREVGQYDQFYISGQQSHRESVLYGEVEYVVTDCPLLLGPFYHKHYTSLSIVESAVVSFIEYAKSQGVTYHNYLLKRIHAYDPSGRYEDENEALEIDNELGEYLDRLLISYESVDATGSDAVNFIIEDLTVGK